MTPSFSLHLAERSAETVGVLSEMRYLYYVVGTVLSKSHYTLARRGKVRGPPTVRN